MQGLKKMNTGSGLLEVMVMRGIKNRARSKENRAETNAKAGNGPQLPFQLLKIANQVVGNG